MDVILLISIVQQAAYAKLPVRLQLILVFSVSWRYKFKQNILLQCLHFGTSVMLYSVGILVQEKTCNYLFIN